MERLTGNNDAYHDLVETGYSTCEEICSKRGSCEGCPIQRAIDKLEAYENSGLEPAEFTAREEMIKQIFRKYIMQRSEDSENSERGDFKVAVSFAMCDVTELYSQIFGISYDEAADKLHEKNPLFK